MSLTVTIADIDLPASVKTAAADEINKIINDVKRLILSGLSVLDTDVTDTDEIADLNDAVAAETRARYYIRGTPAEQTAVRYGGKFYSADAWEFYGKWDDPFVTPEHTEGETW